MKIEMDQLMALVWQVGSLLLIMLLGFFCFLVIRKGLERMLAGRLITQSFYVVAKNSMRWLLVIVVVAASLQQLDIKITNILTALLTIAGMIAIGFIAVWSVLSNILCSMLLVVFRNFDMGDEIEIVEPVGGEGLKGRVVGFNIMYTTLAECGDDVDHAMLTQIPNNVFFQKALRRSPGQNTEALGQYLLSKPLKSTSTKEADSA